MNNLPFGVTLRDLAPHRDDRGVFTELFREEWADDDAPPFIQWNAVSSETGVLRGVHVHLVHHDYLTLVAGSAVIGLADLRDDSETFMQATCVDLSAAHPQALGIPPGVAHGFYFPEPATHVYAVSEYWDLADELGCRWDDPQLAIPWPQKSVRLSERDAELPPVAELLEQLAATRAQT
ncbi:MAG: dTDP-4-dehydrorhamnose 3,5-epimerase family protein [Solirubrobacterales bacterium]